VKYHDDESKEGMTNEAYIERGGDKSIRILNTSDDGV
jgi:hypothetical protein